MFPSMSASVRPFAHTRSSSIDPAKKPPGAWLGLFLPMATPAPPRRGCWGAGDGLSPASSPWM
eukprot:3013941-Rhodomonas_salina.2